MILPAINVTDIAALALMGIGAFIGYRRKLSGELAILLSVGAAFFVGLFFYEPLGVWLVNNTKLDVGASKVATYVFLVLAAGIMMVLLRILLEKIMNLVIGENADKLGGMIAGVAKSLFIVLIIYLAMNVIPYDYVNRKFGEESFIGRITLRFLPSLEEVLQEKMDKPVLGD